MISTSCCQRFLLREFSSKRHLFRATCSFVVYNMIIDNDMNKSKLKLTFYDTYDIVHGISLVMFHVLHGNGIPYRN